MIGPTYELDGEPLQGSLEDFLVDNDLDLQTVAVLRALEPGEAYTGGGGAWAEWELKRVT